MALLTTTSTTTVFWRRLRWTFIDHNKMQWDQQQQIKRSVSQYGMINRTVPVKKDLLTGTGCLLTRNNQQGRFLSLRNYWQGRYLSITSSLERQGYTIVIFGFDNSDPKSGPSCCLEYFTNNPILWPTKTKLNNCDSLKLCCTTDLLLELFVTNKKVATNDLDN